MLNPTLQDQVFELILNNYPRRADAVEDICQLLNLAKDPVYRRLRGETYLPPSELSLLCRHYGISLDAIIHHESNNVICSFNAFTRRINDFSEYLNGFVEEFEQIHNLKDPHLHYASAELSVFTYNFFPEIISFKLYIWGRTTWNLVSVRDRQFSLDLVTPPIIRLSQEVLNQYIRINSTELWTAQIMDNTLAQIEYHVYSGGFRDPKEALILVDKLSEWSKHMKLMAAAGKKFNIGEKAELGRGDFNLFYNEMVYTNITALISAEEQQMVYSAFCTPNFLRSTDKRLCGYTNDWFNGIFSKSSRFSGEAEKLRDWYFREMDMKIARQRQRIERYIEENYSELP
ncbi:MAG: hypothetical protein R3A50_02795 [Saprospiraceae bacterium]|nr:hypothetical protein [Lewinellaceae bacterium]